MNSTLSRYFDIRSGTIAAVLMGSIVWWINADYGALAWKLRRSSDDNKQASTP
ncbi:MAG: hypothetical protein HOC23_09290 [Halieaceae bacterium]|jgi:hypothetical protein|nr:hypothetical protein [Halieaceae bacterium]